MFDVPLDDITNTFRVAAKTDAATVPIDEQLAIVKGIEQLRRLMDVTEAHLLAELDANDTCDQRFGLRTARWLAHECGLPYKVAAGRVRVASKVRAALPETDAAWCQGEVGFEHADVLARAANDRIRTDVAEIEGSLLTLAKSYGFEAWKREVTAICDLLDEDGGHDPERERRLNRFFMNWGLDGHLHVKGTFTGVEAARFEEAVNRAADRQFHVHRQDAELTSDLPVPSRPELQALGLFELVRHGHSAMRKGTAVEPVADLTILMRSEDSLRRGFTRSNQQLSEELMEFLRCGSDLAVMLIDALGVPLDLGRSQRRANRAQRRAIHARQGGVCAFPGCSVPLDRCDVHHVRWWTKDGRTDLHNLIGLCRHHHGVTHRRGWSLVANGDGTFTWTTPGGQQLRSRPPPNPTPA